LKGFEKYDWYEYKVPSKARGLISGGKYRMNSINFASRNSKEILRDPITLIFSLGFPLVLLVLLSAINKSIPTEAGASMTLFRIEKN